MCLNFVARKALQKILAPKISDLQYVAFLFKLQFKLKANF